MSNIDISVVVAVKNEEVHVETAIQSILNQSSPDIEVIVVDDNSSDSTFEILTRLGMSNPKLLLSKNPKAGKCSAFNYGVTLAKGRFVCIFAGDDIMPEGSLLSRFESVRDQTQDSPVVGLCKLITMSDLERFDGHLVPRKPGFGALSGVSPLMNRAALHKIFPVPEILPNEDTWMEIAILHFPDWKVIHSDIIGCKWRVHAGNSINMLMSFPDYNRKISSRLRAYALFLDRYRDELSRADRDQLVARVQCESHRSKGNVLGVLCSKVGLVDRLRALSITNGFFYGIRRHLYGLFSGW